MSIETLDWLDLPTKFWLYVIFAIVLIIALLSYILTGGYAFRYFKLIDNEKVAIRLLSLHLIISFLLGLGLPNNLLDQYEFFRKAYEENQMWIPFSMLTIIFIFIMLIGSIITYLSTLHIENEQKNHSRRHFD
jgi:uncharacterized membrane protein